ncbi:HK97 family phage prohead protease, partial [uncultured Peptoniphilus sp.]|uniref:HK97 family phage prohead protease n=1 Tax=uncultured Peptoniphilus sp. TaxID=254354 RepID=UPI002595B5D8
MEKIQYRTNKINFREKENDEELRIEGYFVVYDDETELWDGVYEKIDRNAFDGELDKDIRALAGHDTERVLGRTKNKTLTLRSDEKGLWGSILINRDDPEAFSLYQKVKRGDIDKCSFGFIPTEEESVKRGDGGDLFVVKRCDLIEVSVVAFPAYENTSINARKNDFEKSRGEYRKKKLREKLNEV